MVFIELDEVLTIESFHLPTLIHNSSFINKCMLHYYPRHVSSINMPILLLLMYSYCSSMYSYRCLCILIVVYVFLDADTLTEVFPVLFPRL